MIEAWSVDRVREAEAALMEGLPEGELMERAATGLAGVLRARTGERRARSVTALVGPGNNGGDALYAVARLAREGAAASAVHTGTVHEGARAAAEAAGVVLHEGGGPESLECVRAADVVVDGILGIGGRPGLPDWARPWVEAVAEDALVVAVDLPSGQDPAGRVATADAVFADETVTFGVPKPVHLLPATEMACGRLTVVDIGLTVGGAPAVRRLTRDDVAGVWPVPGPGDDKYSRGVLGVVAGGEGFTGAALMTTATAVAAGAGMVRYVGTPAPEGLVRAHVPEAVHGAGRVQAWVVGPGLDTTATGAAAEAQLGVAREALASELPVLLDAGGLDLLTGRRDAPTLLTPHAGELARLLSRLGDPSGGTSGDGAGDGPGSVARSDVEADPVGHARRAAALTGATVLLKGNTTLVVGPDPESPVHSQADAPSWLATAGSGDVLAGLAGTLLASGLGPALAGALAGLVHGTAADEANPGGPVRAMAVAGAIPATIASLLRRGRAAP